MDYHEEEKLKEDRDLKTLMINVQKLAEHNWTADDSS